MNIAAIGHTVMDFIHQGEKSHTKPGGLYFTVSGLINVREEGDNIFPVTNTDKKYSDRLMVLRDYCRQDFIAETDIPQVHLTINNSGERGEEYKNLTEKLNIVKFIDCQISFDGILVNMITGFDIAPVDLHSIRNKYDCPIYLDIHSLARGIDPDGTRRFRQIKEPDKWLSSANIVQMNENEILTISTEKNEFDRIREILSFGPEMAIITKAEKGAVLYRKENDEIERIFVSSVKEPGENRVGCGDVFGAAFFYSYICGNSIYTALKFANTAAGVITNYFNFKDYENLKNDIGKRFY